MSRWRREALQRLPSLKATIESADCVMFLWTELWFPFVDAYRRVPPDEVLIAGVYDFADWCLSAKNTDDASTDPGTAVCCCFFEELPTDPLARDDMPRWLPFVAVANNEPMFSYHIGADGYRELLAFMSKNRHRYMPRPLRA